MEPLYLEDVQVGTSFRTGTVAVTEASIVAFAREYDPQPMHLTHEDAAAGSFGRLVASGWQTASLTMRLLVDTGVFAGKGGLGLGVDDLRWTRPVEPGDELHATVTIAATRPLGSKPFGAVTFAVATANQRDETVLTASLIGRVPMRAEVPA